MRAFCKEGRLSVQVADLKAELGTELLAQLSAAERAELAKLAPQLKSLQVCAYTPSLLYLSSLPSFCIEKARFPRCVPLSQTSRSHTSV